jgi:hypothetical protein
MERKKIERAKGKNELEPMKQAAYPAPSLGEQPIVVVAPACENLQVGNLICLYPLEASLGQESSMAGFDIDNAMRFKATT